MANKSLFSTLRGLFAPPPDTRNEAGGPAYTLAPEQALAQYTVTGCLNATFYAGADDQLADVLRLASACEPTFVAQAAIYARESGHMKDLPALLCAVLAARDTALLARAFPRVIVNGKMLRNFVQILRSGVTGRKSLGTLPQRLVRQWLAERSDEQVFEASIGNDPSLADIIKMVHPKPATAARANLYAYLLGKTFDASLLPAEAAALERCKLAPAGDLPDVPFLFLTSLPLTAAQWATLAVRLPWQATRMNLNTMLRHGVFHNLEATAVIAARLADTDAIARARVFPYQIMTTLMNADAELPSAIRAALATALDLATANVPRLPGHVVVAVDVSGSMHSPVTGRRKGATTNVRCLDVAALFAAAILRHNPQARVLPFHDRVCDIQLDPTASVLATAQALAALPAGGTNCSAVLAHLNAQPEAADVVIYLSDNQSWIDAGAHAVATGMLAQWRKLRRRNPRAKLVCIDLQAYRTVQAPVADDVVHVGGFSDQVFEVVRATVERDSAPDLFVDRIRTIAV